MSAAVDRRFAFRVFLMLGGLLVWALHFLFVYVFAALACARAFADLQVLGVGIVPLTIVAATVVALLALAWHVGQIRRFEHQAEALDARTPRFMHSIGLAIVVYAAAAVLLQTLPVLMIPTCA